MTKLRKQKSRRKKRNNIANNHKDQKCWSLEVTITKKAMEVRLPAYINSRDIKKRFLRLRVLMVICKVTPLRIMRNTEAKRTQTFGNSKYTSMTVAAYRACSAVSKA